MEDSFRVRVDKAFGSLSSSASLRSLWRLTDDELQRKQECPPNLYHPVQSNTNSITDTNNDMSLDLGWEMGKPASFSSSSSKDYPKPKPKPDDYDEEEWEIKSSIGWDSTLDYEEEEDDSDKVAVGKIKDGDRLYMRDMSDYGIYVDSCNELPNSFRDVTKDPRANHMAAKLRLKEDAEAAKKMDSLQVTEKAPPAADLEINSSEDGNLKSILKRKDDELDSMPQNSQSDSKSQKRVRFDPECKDGNGDDSDGVEDTLMETDSAEAVANPLPPDYPSGIPDYMRNPSKYTHYTLDASSNVDEESNRQAYMDFINMLKASRSEEPDDISIDLPRSLTFTPKRKSGGSIMDYDSTKSKQNWGKAGNESTIRSSFLVGIAAGNEEESFTCAMEEDEPETEPGRRNRLKISSRQYRTKAMVEMDESV